jgi:ATPase subunit of ABC transporter with duplicated ATPase domains
MAAVLEAQGVGVAWAAAVPVLTDVSFVLTAGFHGLVGANGAGKTTLLRVLAGELAPHEGTVRVQPPGATIAYCPQDIDAITDDIQSLAGAYDGPALALRGRLRLEEDQLERWSTLSPGERKRWQIAAALVREPEILLLDEPTNHLDGEARERLLSTLGRYRGVAILVSHDREVLERLPRTTLRVHSSRVSVYPGRYSQARAEWEQERRGQEEAHLRARAAVRAVERRLDAVRRTQEAASRATSARARMKDKNDNDARSMGAKVVAGWADARAGRTVQVVREELARTRSAVPGIERDRTVGGKVFASFQRAPNAVLFHLDAPAVRAPGSDHVVLRDVRVTIGRQDRIRITGANGAGKTTLLEALVRSRRGGEADGRVLYLPQELGAEAIQELTADLRTLGDEERGRVLSVFAALGSDPERLVAARRPDARAALSPGEARKLALATGLGRHVWALVLDEPTNHLDLPTIERLERALAD